MFAGVFSGNVACHLNSLEESTSSQLPCVWGREILQGRNKPGRCAAPWGRQAKRASLIPECQSKRWHHAKEIQNQKSEMEAGKSHFLTNEIFRNIDGRQLHTAYESAPLLWLLRPQHGTFFKLLTNTKDSRLCRHCQIYKQFFCVWKHSVISGLVYGSSSIWRRLKSLMRAEGPAAFSLHGTRWPFQRQLQPLHSLIVSMLPRRSSRKHIPFIY